MSVPANCARCGLFETCKSWKVLREVHSETKGVDVLFVGEAPGAEEDKDARPFIGPAGKFLRSFIDGFEGTMSYAITTVVKCMPPDNRKPTEKEITECSEFLQNDIEQTNPKIIVALGAAALNALWPTGPKTINKARISPVRLGKRWLLTTYHPSMHISGRQDLNDEYSRLGGFIDDLLTGKKKDTTTQADIRVPTERDIPKIIAQCAKSLYVVNDVETNHTSKDPLRLSHWLSGSKLLALGIGTSAAEPFWVIPRHLLTRELVIQLLTGKIVVGHNDKFDLTVLMNEFKLGQDFPSKLRGMYDTMLANTAQDLGKFGNGLKELAANCLGEPTWDKELWDLIEALNAERKRIKQPMTASMEDVPFSTLSTYCGQDVYNTVRLKDWQQARKYDEQESYPFLVQASLALATVEYNGIPCDKRRLDVIEKLYQKNIRMLEAALKRQPEVMRLLRKDPHLEVNVASPKFQQLLLDECGLDVIERTPTGKPKMDKAVLAALAKESKAFHFLSQAKKNRQVISKFLAPLRDYIAPDGRVHTSYKVGKSDTSSLIGGEAEGGGTITGRLASANPNLQNLSKDKIIRRIFSAPKGYTFMEFDYSQIELRLIALESRCKNMIQALQTEDLHATTARMIYNIPADQPVPDAKRAIAKNQNFLVCYGGGPSLLAEKAGVSKATAEALFAKYKRVYPEIFAWTEQIANKARSGKAITTRFGRTRTFRYVGDDGADSATDRQVANFPIQATASDRTLKALIKCLLFWREYHNKSYASQIEVINVVHDSLWFLVADHLVLMVAKHQKHLMEDNSEYPWLTVPTPVDIKIGKNLGQMEKYVA